MFDFLALPTEIRYEIYRHLRRYVSLRLAVPVSSFGYASYGFYPEILMTNHQISYEAKQVFYGENDWTFYACRDIQVHSDYSKLAPLCSALPFIRRAHIRFRLYHWLYDQFMSFPKYPDTVTFRANINQISKLLAKARCLQSLKLIWTETAKHPVLALDIGPEAGMTNFWRSHIDKIVQPLTTIQRSCTVRKSDVVVRYMQSTGPFGRPSGHAIDMENAFSSSIDGLIAMRASSAR
ncbi:hypothetical protein JMJ35_000478 [Cladonia borealis]|uniref:F-box domain-containing protein n=1 Tax=Cladonia borealis TaxID=184061 RepID=A0AA39R9I2_9LECA|nr:hypothetical protein JMJ35_000478 [Cladonia borealis]